MIEMYIFKKLTCVESWYETGLNLLINSKMLCMYNWIDNRAR